MDIKKAKGSSDTVQSDHIERRIIPKNADPTRTHLNRVLIEYPDGVHGVVLCAPMRMQGRPVIPRQKKRRPAPSAAAAKRPDKDA